LARHFSSELTDTQKAKRYAED